MTSTPSRTTTATATRTIGKRMRARRTGRLGVHGRPRRTDLLRRLAGTGGAVQAIVCRGESYAHDSDDSDADNGNDSADYHWMAPVAATLVYAARVNNADEPGLRLSDARTGYAGFDARTGLYWRYADEARAGGGEHCLKVVAVLDRLPRLRRHRKAASE